MVNEFFEVVGVNDMRELLELYRDVDSVIKDFCSIYNLHCPEGCGFCCADFIPSISTLEAEYIADLCEATPIMINPTHGTSCPFFLVVGEPYHCSIYNYRPLICRLFGYSGAKNKTGVTRFRACRFMGVSEATTTVVNQQTPSIPAMENFGNRLQAMISPLEDSLPIHTAVQSCLSKRQMRAHYEALKELQETTQSSTVIEEPQPF